MADGGEAVGDHQRGALGGDSIEGALDRRFGFVVHRGGGFIEDQHRWVLEDGAGQGDALSLAAREPLAPFAHDRVVPLGQGLDEAGGLGQLCSPLDGGAGRIEAAVGDVLGHRAVEQEHLLAHQADGPAQIRQLQIPDRQAIEQDLALLQLVQAQQQPDDGALAGAGGADDAQGAAGWHLQIEALQQRLAAGIGEAQATEAQGALHGRRGQGAVATGDGDRRVEQIEYPLGGGHRPLVVVEGAAQAGERPEQALGDVHQEGIGADGDLTAPGLQPADHQDRQEGEQDREADQRDERR